MRRISEAGASKSRPCRQITARCDHLPLPQRGAGAKAPEGCHAVGGRRYGSGGGVIQKPPHAPKGRLELEAWQPHERDCQSGAYSRRGGRCQRSEEWPPPGQEEGGGQEGNAPPIARE